MKNIKLIISYDGTDFHGWQFQPEMRTVAGELKAALEIILTESVLLKAASRTDSGVHAIGQTVHFKTENNIELSKLVKGVNSILPEDISVLSMEYMPEDFHSTYDSKGKHYCYQILNSETDDPFSRKFHWLHPYSLNISAMEKAAKFMIGEEVEFKGLYINSTNPNVFTIRNISEINFRYNHLASFIKGELLFIDIYGKSFMYKMVRSLVGLLVAVGSGRIAPEKVPELLNAEPGSRISNVAPAKGLTLVEVYY